MTEHGWSRWQSERWLLADVLSGEQLEQLARQPAGSTAARSVRGRRRQCETPATENLSRPGGRLPDDVGAIA